MKKKTNFDLYLEKQSKDPAFANRFRNAGKAWDLAIQLVSLRKKVGLSQKELAKRVGTSQQQISRLESPSYEGHSLSMLRRVAEVLGGAVHVEIHHKKEHFLRTRQTRALAKSGNTRWEPSRKRDLHSFSRHRRSRDIAIWKVSVN